ncbi:MAG TPA: NADH-quinone oxidoreductase subunit J [Candidatus Omnitrophota bacterium]|nr:NADH-quinone oxidoreductase subunit J [Candidatus Omnitrophota bacterium]
MEILTIGAKFGVYIVMALVLVFALGVVTLRNLFHSALCLAAVLVGTATVYLALRADFVAAIQILVYVGAVMTLIIFAIMLTEHLGEKTIRQTNRQSPAAILGLLGFIFMIGLVILRTPWPVTKRALATGTSVMSLGKALMGSYVFPFEIISVILIAALIGAVVIAKKDPEEKS